MKYPQQSVGKEKAIELAKSKWWETQTPQQIAKFQFFTKELCMPFDLFHKALEKSLGRSVYTHEFALGADRIAQELLGEADAPTFQEIIDLIPKDKRVIIIAKEDE